MPRLNTTTQVCTHQQLRARYGSQPIHIAENVILPTECGECDLCVQNTKETVRNMQPVSV